ncbi:porin [Burkholderia cepacia]|uniref:porin n=1 Tax=Burkholderia cepacia TaxID=292 RepID=UPI000F59FD93|nr:porin [Burkholderia cepacia]RQU90569.1 porin [Burkholderia cenocepacia]RQV30317.1 porin [Burkholderia cenocepacia]RQV88855.1 porin [Burkholderia cenocepacia]RQZ91035.1 porin [Burkholderia cepacia]RQZ98407.1 porin [Burkholderia cenocepacia]
MKNPFYRNLLCAALFGAFSVASHAQSTVTLYGVIDEGVVFQSNSGAGKRVSLDSLGGIFGSRWGMTGSEDLGGGLKAIFTLESGINLNNGAFGQGGTAFGRQAFVGLSSDRLGSLTLGRQYDMIFYFPEPLTAEGLLGGPASSHPGDLDNAANTVRVNNAIRYMSPTFNGLKFGGEYSVGGVAGNLTANSGYSVGASYEYGPFKVAGAYEYFKNPTSATAGSGFFTDNASGASPLAFSLNSGYKSAQSFQNAIVAANYKIGALTLAASYSNIQYGHLNGELLGGTARFNNFDIGAQYQFSPFFFAGIMYNYLNGRGVGTASGATIGGQHYNQVGLMANYFLSKRTDVYFTMGWQRASGISSTGAAAVADIGNYGDSSNNHQILIRAALRHRF